MRKQWVLSSLTNVQANEKADVAAVTSSLKPRIQPDSINQGNRQPALVAVSMTSYLRHQPDDRVDLELGMPKIRTETVTKPSITHDRPYRDERMSHDFGSQQYQAQTMKIEWAGWIIDRRP